MFDYAMEKITPVLMAGGSGTRLWPVSRKSFPKQFTPLLNDESLFQSSARRLVGSEYNQLTVTTNADFRFIVAEQLEQVGISPAKVIVEPVGRNTAPAILAATLSVAELDPDGLVLVSPSDHLIPDTKAFGRAVMQGAEIAREGRIVVFGIPPDRPETGYGYLELQELGDGPQALRRFVEKPAPEQAAEMCADRRYLWNAGIFLFRAKDMIEAFRTHGSEYLQLVQLALADAQSDLGFLRLAPAPWAGVPDQSIDYAVMEHAGNLTVLPLGCHWADLGGWDAVWREGLRGNPNEADVMADANSTAIECNSTLLRSDGDMQVVGIGLQDMMVVATGDAVLVAGMDRAQDVRLAVQALGERNCKQATQFPGDHRPWGWFETLALAERFHVKRIVVKPGASMSLQQHMHRAEHWIVVSGTARVTIDECSTLVTENQSVYVPLGSVHRLENPGKFPVIIVEVQTGAYLCEDDITRYADIYARESLA